MKQLLMTACAVSLCVLAPAAALAQQTLRVADSWSATHQYAKNAQKWLERAEELSDGELKLEYYPGEQLGKAMDMLDNVASGVAQIGYVAPLYLSDQLPLSTVSSVPQVGNLTDSGELSAAYADLVMNVLTDIEYLPQGVRPIRALVSTPYQIMTRHQSMETLDDIKGLKLRSSGGVQERSVEALGAVAVQIPAPDLYPALQRGTVDGTLFNLVTASSYRLNEQLKWSTNNLNLGLFPVVYIINEDVWQGLSEKSQNALVEASKEVLTGLYDEYDASIADFGAMLQANGGGMVDLPEATVADVTNRLEPVREAWIETNSAAGRPAHEIIEAWEARVTK